MVFAIINISSKIISLSVDFSWGMDLMEIFHRYFPEEGGALGKVES